MSLWSKIKEKATDLAHTDTKAVTRKVLGSKFGGAVNRVFTSKNVATFIPIAAVGFDSGRKELLKGPYASYFRGQVNSYTGGVGGDVLSAVADRVENGAPKEPQGSDSGTGGGDYWNLPSDANGDGSGAVPGWMIAVGVLVLGLISFLVFRKR